MALASAPPVEHVTFCRIVSRTTPPATAMLPVSDDAVQPATFNPATLSDTAEPLLEPLTGPDDPATGAVVVLPGEVKGMPPTVHVSVGT